MKLININPPIYVYTALLIMLLLHLFIPSVKFIHYPYTLTGILPITIGIVLNLTADSILKKYNTTVKPTLDTEALITTGVFRITRNPMYLGFILILLGIAILLGSIWPFVITICFAVVMYSVFILFEEKKLENEFGSKWSEYKNTVRRWI
jgi:protein-S-isoprenylcysteine O-methyltransferase Ste14